MTVILSWASFPLSYFPEVPPNTVLLLTRAWYSFSAYFTLNISQKDLHQDIAIIGNIQRLLLDLSFHKSDLNPLAIEQQALIDKIRQGLPHKYFIQLNAQLLL